MTPLEIAIRFVGLREESKNRSSEITKFWLDTSYPTGAINREPWCAAFVCYCLAQASREGWVHKAKALPREGAVRYFLDWCRGRDGVDLFNPTTNPLLPGDIIIFLPNLSHIGFLESVDGQTLRTIEGNTNIEGGREGDGVYRRKRAITYPGWVARLR